MKNLILPRLSSTKNVANQNAKSIFIMVLTLTLFGFTKSFAQYTNSTLLQKLWERSTGSPDTLDWSAEEIDYQGNIIITGNTIVASQKTNMLTTKYNSSGTQIWQTTFNNSYSENDYGTAIISDGSGNIFVAGTSYNSSTNNYDFNIIKYNSSGTQQWQTYYNGTASSYDVPTGIVLDGSGNIYVCGTTNTSSALTNYLTMKLNSSGTIQWTATYDYASLIDIAASIIIQGNRIVVTGASQSSFTNWDFATVKYNTSGTQMSVIRNTAPGNGYDHPTAVAKFNDDYIYVTGSGFDPSNGYDFKTIKLDTLLNTIWTKTYDKDGLDDGANDIELDAAGNIYVTGWSETASGGRDYTTIKYNSGGTELWVKNFSAPDATQKAEAKKLSVQPTGYVFVTGYIEGGVNKDFETLVYDESGNFRGQTIWKGTGDDVPSFVKADISNNVYVTGRVYTGSSFTYEVVKYNFSDFITPPDAESCPSGFGFYENKGQLIDQSGSARDELKFYTTSHSPKLFIDSEKLYIAFSRIDTSHSTTDTLVRVDMEFHGHNRTMKLNSVDAPVPGFLNYYLPQCSTGITDVNGYKRLLLTDVYDDVDVMYYGNSAGLKYYVVCKPGFTNSDIHIKFTGADSVKILTNGKLLIYTKLGALKFEAPTAFQLNNSGTVVTLGWVPAYSNVATNTIGFTLGTYNTNYPLIITVQKAFKPAPPIPTGYTLGNDDWCTFYGDFDDDLGLDVCTDPGTGDTYMAGRTRSANFPVTSGVTQPVYGGSNDGFIVKFNIDAVRKWSTFYGGQDFDVIQSLAFNSNTGDNQLYGVGKTKGSTFPVVTSLGTSSFNDNSIGGDYDGFLIRLKPSTGEAKWATYFGGAGFDDIRSVVFDAVGNIEIAGNTLSTTGQNNSCLAPSNTSFPLCNSTSGYYKTTNSGGQDCFFAKFNTNDQLLWSTFFGSDADDQVFELASNFDTENSSTSIYAAGITNKLTTTNPSGTNCTVRNDGGFPVCNMSGSNDYFELNDGPYVPNAFIVNFNLDGTLRWSTMFNDIEGFQTVASDNDNRLVAFAGPNLIGLPASACSPQAGYNIPICTPAGAFSENAGQLYLAKFNTVTNGLNWSTLYNGTPYPIPPSIINIKENGALAGDEIHPVLHDKYLDLGFDGNHNLYSAGSVFISNFETYQQGGFYFQPDLNLGNTTGVTPITDCFLAGFTADNKRFVSTHFGGSYTNPFAGDIPNNYDLTGAISTYISGGRSPCDGMGDCSLLYLVGYTGMSEDDPTTFPLFDAGPQPSGDAYYFTVDNPSFDIWQWNAFITRFNMSELNVGINEPVLETTDIFNVFPNPTSGSCSIIFNGSLSGSVTISVKNVLGIEVQKVIFLSSVAGELYQIDISQFPTGIYFIELNCNDRVWSSKIVKQ